MTSAFKSAPLSHPTDYPSGNITSTLPNLSEHQSGILNYEPEIRPGVYKESEAAPSNWEGLPTSLTSPTVVPRDVMAEIFFHLNEKGIIFYIGTDLKTVLPCLAASHVCTHWRNIIHSTPFLWSSITVHGSPSRIWEEKTLLQQ